MKKKIESIHQEFERYMRDEMDDTEKKMYIKSENYKTVLKLLTKTLSNLKKKSK
jgi:hypothetical protein|tara:strand:- start:274 stop:435 length:162 start_codon:yes stop_codon:yes gene_type:complete